MSSHLECLICTHDMGWHRQKLGACLECGCGAFQFQPHETLAELERLEKLEFKREDLQNEAALDKGDEQ